MKDYIFEDIPGLLTQSEDDLYALLSQIILGSGLGVGTEDPDEQRKFGRSWFKDRRADIQKIVCEGQLFSRIRGIGNRKDSALHVATIADGLASLFGKPAALVIAILVIRTGLDKFCSFDEIDDPIG